jgi:hypothetical protein
MSRCVRRYLPVLNRCVIFNVTDQAFHGHPYPLTCPEGTTRRSIALYYYTAERPAHERSPAHAVLYQSVPGQGGPVAPSPPTPGGPPAAATATPARPEPHRAARASRLRRRLRRLRRALFRR